MCYDPPDKSIDSVIDCTIFLYEQKRLILYLCRSYLLFVWLSITLFLFYKNRVYKKLSLIFGLKLRTSQEQAEAENFEKNKSKH